MHPRARPATENGREPRRTLVVGDMFRSVSLFSTPPPEVTYTVVDYMPDLSGLLVHPVSGSVTVAGLREVCPEDASAVVLRVRHANPAGAPFLITARIEDRPLSPEDFPEPSSTPVSLLGEAYTSSQSHAVGPLDEGAWQRVEAGDVVRVRFNLHRTFGRSAILHLATRPAEQGVSNAWAVVEHVEFEQG